MALESARTQQSPERRFNWQEELHQLDSGVNVELKWSVLHPQKKQETAPDSPESEKSTVIYLTGWGDTRLESQGELTQWFADFAKDDAYIISLRSQERGQRQHSETDFMYEEARAVAAFIKAKGLKNVTLVGFSQGGPRAINAECILQDDPAVSINGVVLLDSVGVYEQNPIALLARFGWHTGPELKSALSSAPESAQAVQRQGERDVRATQAEELKRSGFIGWTKRQISELWEMGKMNPRFAQVRAPIVMISGLSDRIASRERILPEAEEWQMRKSLGESSVRALMRRWGLPVTTPNKTMTAREQLLRKNVFRSSEYVRWLVPGRADQPAYRGHHLVNIFRPEQVAKTALYMLERKKPYVLRRVHRPRQNAPSG